MLMDDRYVGVVLEYVPGWTKLLRESGMAVGWRSDGGI
jgi:hypothetical protein